MTVAPGPVRYASSERGYVAYQVSVDEALLAGPQPPRTVVLLYTLTSSFESLWELPSAVAVLQRLAAHVRIVLVDRRGTGPSDPLVAGEVPTPSTHAADVAAVLRDLDASPAMIVGESYMGGPAAVALAVEHPDLVDQIMLIATPVRGTGVAPDTDRAIEAVLWGNHTEQAQISPVLMPSVEDDPAFVAWSERAGRATGPAVAKLLWEQMLSFDMTELLPQVAVPVTVVRTGHWTAPHPAVDELVGLLSHATVLDIDRPDTLMFVGQSDELMDELLLVATGSRHRGRARRRLLAVVFSDLAGSTERATALGDRAWSAALDQHDHIVAEVVRDHDGRMVKHTGDGALATFALPSAAVAAAASLVARLEAAELPARAGVHVGEVEVRGEDIGGVAVHIAARVCGAADAGEVLVTAPVIATSLGTDHAFAEPVAHELRGVPGMWPLAAVK